MGTYHGPKVRLTRRAGAPVAETPKHTNVRRPTRPGMHARRRTRTSLYGEQLAEKQKLCAYYNIRDRQFTRHIEQAQAKPGSTTDALQQILESRLDNVIRRLRWARTIWQARQMVAHGHFYVNGHKVDIASYQVSPGEEITVKPGSEPFVRAAHGVRGRSRHSGSGVAVRGQRQPAGQGHASARPRGDPTALRNQCRQGDRDVHTIRIVNRLRLRLVPVAWFVARRWCRPTQRGEGVPPVRLIGILPTRRKEQGQDALATYGATATICRSFRSPAMNATSQRPASLSGLLGYLSLETQ